ncbi:MAG: hypothetical protein KKE17_03115 [Proteobacteria bacterium]|nr:hypothetical protein [Pseudomonadota bacterium]MBU1708973.1 hypothetical protein [Pseudomonadota bacterium]
MNQQRPSPGFFATIILSLIFATVLCGYGIKKINYRKHPVLGDDPIERIHVAEDHKFALSQWAEQGITNAILVNLDAHDDLTRISEVKINELRELLNSINLQSGKQNFHPLSAKVADSNFLYAACKLGIIREVYWIIPWNFFQSQNPEMQMTSLLKNYNFTDKDIESFTFTQGCFRGLMDDSPLNICGLETMPDITEQVVLSIDVDFAPVMADSYREQITESVHRAMSALFTKKYRIKDLFFAYSVNGGHLNTHHRWIGDLTLDLIKNPDMLTYPELPSRYATLQRAELLNMMGRYNALLTDLGPMAKQNEPDPGILMYVSQGLKGIGKADHSFRFAETACLQDRNYCYGLPELGASILTDKGLDAAEKFFTRGYELNPEMAHGQFKLAQAMKKAGRLDNAIEYLKIFRAHYGAFPADFYLGEIYALKGDYSTALDYFNSGRTELVNDVHAWAGFGDTGMVNIAIRFYDDRGSKDFADELRSCLNTKEKYYPAIHSMGQ